MRAVDISNSPVANMFRDEGRVEQVRSSILQGGRKKFGAPAPVGAVAAIQGMTDLGALTAVFGRVFDVSTWDELLADGP